MARGAKPVDDGGEVLRDVPRRLFADCFIVVSHGPPSTTGRLYKTHIYVQRSNKTDISY